MTTSTQTQLRRGTAAQCDAMTPVAGELIIDLTNDRVRVGDGSKQGGWQVPNSLDMQTQDFISGTAGGTADALTLTLTPQPTAWTAFMRVVFKVASANATTAPTLGITGLSGVKTIKKKGKTGLVALAKGDLQPGVIYSGTFDGTYVQIEAVDLPQTSGLVWLATKTLSGDSSADFKSLIASGYSEFSWVLEDIKVSTNNTSLLMQTSSDNGATFDSGVNNYFYNNGSNIVYSSTVGANADLNYAMNRGTFILLASSIGNAAAEGLSGKITVRNPLGTARKKIFRSEMEWQDGSTIDHWLHGASVRDSTSKIDAITIYPGAGTLTGAIHMYGLTKG